MRARLLAPVLVLAVALAACGTAVEGTGYSLEPPEGWREVTDEESIEAIPIRFDVALAEREAEGGFSTNLTVIREPAPPRTTLDQIGPAFRRQLEAVGATNVTPARDSSVDGEEALTYEYRARGGLRGRQVVTVRDGGVYTVTLTARASEFPEDNRGFEEILSSWSWD